MGDKHHGNWLAGKRGLKSGRTTDGVLKGPDRLVSPSFSRGIGGTGIGLDYTAGCLNGS